MTVLIIIVAVLTLIGWGAKAAEKKRREALMQKYGDEGLVDRIMKKMFWQGQTPGQLEDSLGKPADVDTRVMKSKTREVWKYNSDGKNRYRLKITLENDVVVGWDQR